jgi:hypothetical protein
VPLDELRRGGEQDRRGDNRQCSYAQRTSVRRRRP